ncbi:hypothetical protein NtRootA1_20380 [Arthrobacter sp. NtRootA1]|nr:hypothetical protein NtRootA1_20380 [Arthrobacter sp. NtRootA1]
MLGEAGSCMFADNPSIAHYGDALREFENLVQSVAHENYRMTLCGHSSHCFEEDVYLVPGQ